MSSALLSKSISDSINLRLENFIERSCEEFSSLKKEELLELWNRGQESLQDSKKDTSIINVSLTVSTLKEMCRKRGLKVSGKKEELLQRLNGGVALPVETPDTKKKPASKPTTSKNSIIDKIKRNSTIIFIRLNKFGNPEHPPTGLVFDKEGENVIGKQGEDGKIEELEECDIENCLRYAFSFTMPENLDKKFKLDDIKVDALDEILNHKETYDEEEEEEGDED